MKRLRGSLLIAAAALLLAGFVLIVRYGRLPPYAVVAYSLALPALVTTSASGFVNAIVPGAMSRASHRFHEGDSVVIGSLSAPFAAGKVIDIRLYAVTLEHPNGDHSNVTMMAIQPLSVTHVTDISPYIH